MNKYTLVTLSRNVNIIIRYLSFIDVGKIIVKILTNTDKSYELRYRLSNVKL